MEIKLTRAQYLKLAPIIRAAMRDEKTLGLPLEIDNGDQKIEVSADETKITLTED